MANTRAVSRKNTGDMFGAGVSPSTKQRLDELAAAIETLKLEIQQLKSNN